MYVCALSAYFAHGGQKQKSELLKLELWTVISHEYLSRIPRYDFKSRTWHHMLINLEDEVEGI